MPSGCSATLRAAREARRPHFGAACAWLGLLWLLAAPAWATYPTGSRIAWVEDWDAAQARARREGKPLFVYFHAQWCTWCRIYQAETLERPRVAALLQSRFVPVLLHADQRRDHFTRLGGRGLPHTVWLDLDGTVRLRFTGHVAAGDLLDVLSRAAPGRNGPAGEPVTMPVDPIRFEAWLDELYDPASARFLNASHLGSTGKRPQPLSLIYLLDAPAWRDRMPAILDALLTDLEDPVEGGFYFFADRTRPELDELLETSKVLGHNAMILWLLLEAAARSEEPRWAQAARRGIRWLESRLWDAKAGGFWAAQASDNAYHALDAGARRARRPPPLERIKYADSNAQMAFVLVRAAEVLGEPRHAQRAREILRYLHRELRAADGGYFHYRSQGRGRLPGYLPAQLWTLAAMQALARLDGASAWNGAMRELLDVIGQHRAPDGIGFVERRPRPGEAVWTEPASNGLLAWLMDRLPEELNHAAVRESQEQALRAVTVAPGGQPDDVALGVMAMRETGR